MIELENSFPAHKASLHITHNQHLAYYETVEQYEETRIDKDEWASDEERQKAIDTNSLWEIQWYPDTPIGSYSVFGSTLEATIKAAKEVEKVDIAGKERHEA